MNCVVVIAKLTAAAPARTTGNGMGRPTAGLLARLHGQPVVDRRGGSTVTVPVADPPAVTVSELRVKSTSLEAPGALSVRSAFCTIPAPW